MEVGVLLFGPAAAAAQTDRLVVYAPGGATCAMILSSLAAHPRLRSLVEAEGAARLAVNHAFASPQQIVHEGDEVALITMVSGG